NGSIITMPVPKRKVSKARRNKRCANKGLKPRVVAKCQTCQEALVPHSACTACGHYKGKKILRTKSDRMHLRSKKQEAEDVKKRAHHAVAQPSEGAEKE
ncbi:MAG: 50S ribosomal protein L32, partial [bacterium]